MQPFFKYGIVAVAALVGWAVGKNLDGPIVHWSLTALAAWVAWTMVREG
jgi:hypothetical protein